MVEAESVDAVKKDLQVTVEMDSIKGSERVGYTRLVLTINSRSLIKMNLLGIERIMPIK